MLFRFRINPFQGFEQHEKNTFKHKLVDFLWSISSLVLHVLYNNASNAGDSVFSDLDCVC